MCMCVCVWARARPRALARLECPCLFRWVLDREGVQGIPYSKEREVPIQILGCVLGGERALGCAWGAQSG